jgi:hypothetical protein
VKAFSELMTDPIEQHSSESFGFQALEKLNTLFINKINA